MGRPRNSIPKLCIDKSRDRAFVKVDGRFVVLGPAGSSESQAAYGKLLTDLAQNGKTEAIQAAKCRSKSTRQPDGVTWNILGFRFFSEELPRYSAAEQRCIKAANKIVRELFGDLPLTEFGPLKLRIVRDEMIRKGWSRSFINKQVKRIRLILRWGVSFELVPQTAVDALTSIKALAAGESDAKEPRPRRAVPDADLEKVRAVLCERHRDIFDLLLLSGARPGELLNLTTGDIDRAGEIWRAELMRHKTAHKGKSRTLFFNAKAQLILRKYITAKPTERLFSLRGDTLSNAFKAACIKAGVPIFTPHWLRHTVATRLADEVGTEAAQRLLGHSTTAMTLHYSKAAEKQAIEAAKRLG